MGSRSRTLPYQRSSARSAAQRTSVQANSVQSKSSSPVAKVLRALLDLYPQNFLIPQTAIQASVPISGGGSLVGFSSLQPVVSGLYGWSIGERCALTGSTAVAEVKVDGDQFMQFEQVMGCDVSFTENLVGFLEWDCLIDHGAVDDGTQHILDGGIGFPVTNQSQVIGRVGCGLNERAPDLRVGIRYVYRF